MSRITGEDAPTMIIPRGTRIETDAVEVHARGQAGGINRDRLPLTRRPRLAGDFQHPPSQQIDHLYRHVGGFAKVEGDVCPAVEWVGVVAVETERRR